MLVQTGKDFLYYNSPQWAAAIAFYGLLSVFPMLLAAAAIAAYFVDPEWAIEEGARLMGNFIPSGSERIRSIVEGAIQARGRVSLFSILALSWSGSRVFGVVTRALNTAYDTSEPYGFLKRVLVEILMMLTIGLLFVLALSSRFLIGFISNISDVPDLQGNWWWATIRFVIRPLLLVTSVYLTYQFVPRRKVRWWAALAGAIFFTTVFLIAQPLFTDYIRRFANYSLIYGPLAIVIILVLWTWIVANILLLGGELVSHIQDILIEEKPVEQVEERHKKRDPTSPVHEE